MGSYAATYFAAVGQALDQRDPLVRAQVPMLAAATHEVGDPQVRHRGTIGGAIAHGDPAGDLPAVLLALGAELVVDGPTGRRTISIDDFFTGFLETALAPDELLTVIRVPKVPDAGWSFHKFNRRAQDWAIVGVAALLADDRAAVGLVNMDSRPVRATATEAALAGGVDRSATTRDTTALDAAAALAADDAAPPTDGNATAEFRKHLARVLTGRALHEASTRRG